MDCAPLGLSLGKRRGAGDSVCDTNAHGPAERRFAERTERVRDDSTPTATLWCLPGRQLHFRLRLASPAVGNGRRRSTTERRHKTEPNFYRGRNNDDRHADC